LVLQEGLAKKHDVVEYTNHPFIGKVLRSGVEWISEGDILLLPLRIMGMGFFLWGCRRKKKLCLDKL